MKILHVVPSYKPAYVYGGTIESIARLCEGLANAGHYVKVFTTTANGKEELALEPNSEHIIDGVHVVYFRRIFKDPFYISPALSKQLKQDCKNYDVVHIHSWWNMIVIRAAFICKKEKIKYIISPHGMMSDYILQHSKRIFKWLGHFVIGKSLLQTSLYHATSNAESAECNNFIPEWNGFMIPNIVTLPSINISKPQHTHFTIIFLSRIHPKKGIEILMEAISLIHDKPILQIAGSGEEKYIQKLKQKANDLGIAKHVEWLGWQDRDEKFSTLMKADLFALTSYNENFGNVVIEALHSGVPVLVSENTGLSDFVGTQNLGWVCLPTVTDIKSKLEEAIHNKSKREEISKSAPLKIHDYFSEKRLIPEYVTRYQS